MSAITLNATTPFTPKDATLHLPSPQFKFNFSQYLTTQAPKDFDDYEIEVLNSALQSTCNANNTLINKCNSLLEKNDIPTLKKTLQDFINDRISNRDLFKIAVGKDLENFIHAKTTEKVKMVSRYLFNLFFQPIILTVKTMIFIGAIIVSHDKRNKAWIAFKDFIEHPHLRYQTRKAIAACLISLGIGGLIGSIIAADVFSAGLATPFLIAFGSLATIGLSAIITNDRLANKKPILTAAKTTRTVAESMITGCISGFVINKLAAISKLIQNISNHTTFINPATSFADPLLTATTSVVVS